MTQPFKVHLFKVHTSDGTLPLADLLVLASAEDLSHRMRKIGFNQEVRIEEAKAPELTKPYWLLDFGKLRRDGGPGRASDTTPIHSFDLEQGEAFAEETAMLFDPAVGVACLQYNHHGPRAGSISDYLSLYQKEEANLYELLVQLKGDAQARLKNKQIFTRLEMKVAPAKLSDAFKENNVALTNLVSNAQKHLGGDHVYLEIGLDRMSQGNLTIREKLKAFFQLADEPVGAVGKLVIAGREEAGMPIETVDLISEKVEYAVPSLPLDRGLRYPRADRWRALEAAYRAWKAKKLF